jgi:hypothetical protein
LLDTPKKGLTTEFETRALTWVFEAEKGSGGSAEYVAEFY